MSTPANINSMKIISATNNCLVGYRYCIWTKHNDLGWK